MTDIATRVEIMTDKLPKSEEVLDLFGRLNWAKMKYRSPERFQAALERSWPIVTAWDGARLVGICRTVTDGQYTAYIADLAVDPDYQGAGIGSGLVEKTLKLLEDFDTIALVTSLAKVAFWEKHGFANFPGGMMIRR
jgi:ribosomal protein S18 acetylase RimI-like enzyme